MRIRPRRRDGLLSIGLAIMLLAPISRATEPVKVGSKVFTESVIIGEMISQLGAYSGVSVVHYKQLGGTRVLWEALVNGQIDAYCEYTGTIERELLPGHGPSLDELRQALGEHQIEMSGPLGFNDTYALGLPETVAARLHINSISDLQQHPELRLGFSNEFLDRTDGWPALATKYQLKRPKPNGLDHDLAYRAMAAGSIDVIDLYTTDAEIVSQRIRVLDDDRHLFPSYEAVVLYRSDLKLRAPFFIAAIKRLEGTISTPAMTEMNTEAKFRHLSESSIAAKFLATRLTVKTEAKNFGIMDELLLRTREHLFMVVVSLLASILMAVPLGTVAFMRPKLGHVILGTTAMIYTVPALALLVLMIPFLGIGTWPAIAALFLYGLLPIARNTHAGLSGITPSLRESAIVLGLSPWARLVKIELPMASPAIMAGIKTAAVINVGTATIGALIGAGGYGQPIITGIRLADTQMILLGALPAAIMALLVQSSFSVLEIFCVPKGLRLNVRT